MDLKPCPFCGGKKAIADKEQCDGGCEYFVVCFHCDARGPNELSEEEALEAWNERP